MIKHIVIFKLKDGVNKDDARVKQALQLMAEFSAKIPDIREAFSGLNIADRPIAYDFGTVVTVDDMEALGRYLAHPAHQEFVALAKEIATWNIADIPV